MINQEEAMETGTAPQTETGPISGQEFSSEESTLRPPGDIPPQTETASAPSEPQKQDPGFLRQTAESASSQSGTKAKPKKETPRSVVTIDEKPSVETDADRNRSDLLDLIESMRAGRILSGVIQGIEMLPNDPSQSIAVLYYGEFKVVIPAKEAVEVPDAYPGNSDTAREIMMTKRLGAEVDYIVKGVDRDAGVAVASRLEAMRVKRRINYYGRDRDGNYKIYEGICAEARVVAVLRAGIFIELFGLETFVPLKELSYQRIFDASFQFKPGERILVKILELDRSDRNHIKVFASVKQTTVNPYEQAVKKYTIGNKYVGTVTYIDPTGIYVALDGGIDCRCNFPRRGRPPVGAHVTVRILGIKHSSSRIYGAITHVSVAR